ncbi:MAG TPA: hypothetical protein PKK43_07410 [Spirochaetota bacterium]|nr:hypothetical protein [Spirochaetota bacterium]
MPVSLGDKTFEVEDRGFIPAGIVMLPCGMDDEIYFRITVTGRDCRCFLFFMNGRRDDDVFLTARTTRKDY